MRKCLRLVNTRMPMGEDWTDGGIALAEAKAGAVAEF